MKTEDEFWSNVYVGEDNECWNWLRSVNKDGYGRLRYEGEMIYSHRLALKLFNKDIDLKNKVVMHMCDNTRCCNPKHLSVGTHVDNQLDKVSKNRQAKGEKNGNAFLTEKQVLAARKKYKSNQVTYKMLAEEYGVSKDTMQKAIRGIYWSHI